MCSIPYSDCLMDTALCLVSTAVHGVAVCLVADTSVVLCYACVCVSLFSDMLASVLSRAAARLLMCV